MSTDITLFKGGIPAHLRNIELDETTKAIMGGGSSGKRISIKGGVYRMIVDGKEVMKNEDRTLNMVIVAAAPKVSRTYYEGTFVEGENKSPDCWSDDGEFPNKEVKDPQSNKCATCPMNIKGSGQGDTKACRFQHRLAVVLENDLEGDMYQLALPAMSIFGKNADGKMPLQTYARMLASHGLPVTAVVTEARFDTNAATPKLTFRAVRPLEVDEIRAVQERGASDEAHDLISNNPSFDDTKSANTEDDEEFETAKKEEHKQQPKKTEAVEEVTPPKKRAKKEEPKPEPEELEEVLDDDLDAVLKEWE